MSRFARALLLVSLALFGMVTAAQPINSSPKLPPKLLEPKMHLLHGFDSSEPVLAYWRVRTTFALKSLEVKGLRLQSWQFVRASKQDFLEVVFALKPGDDHEFDSLALTLKDGSKRNEYVGPNRVLYLKPKASYEISFERTEQVSFERLYLGMQVFNDSSKAITIEQIVYAPSKAATNKIIVSRYDPAWFDQLERWVGGPENVLPSHAKFLDSRKLNLILLPSRGFSAAIVRNSILAKFNCGDRPRVGRLDSAFLQVLIVYRVGKGPKQVYPIPDEILADVCF